MIWALADTDLPRLPAARHRQQHLQRLARAGAHRPRARGAPAVPGPRGRRAAVRGRDGHVGRRRAAGGDAPRAGALHGLPAGHRAGAARLRGRRVRGLRRRPLPGPERRAARRVPGPQRGSGRGGGEPRPTRRRAGQPPRRGPRYPRSLARRPDSLRGQGARQRARVRGAPASRALPSARARGAGRRGRGARRFASHRREPVAHTGRPRLPARTRLGPPGVDVHAFRPRDPDEAADRLRELAERLRGDAGGWGGRRAPRPRSRPSIPGGTGSWPSSAS